MSNGEKVLPISPTETSSSNSYVQRTLNTLVAEYSGTDGTIIEISSGELDQVSSVVNSPETFGDTSPKTKFSQNIASETTAVGSGINLGDYTKRGLVYSIADHRKRRLAQKKALEKKVA